MEKPDKYKEEPLYLIEKCIRKNGYKLTYQRKEILKVFIKNSHRHLSGKELYE